MFLQKSLEFIRFLRKAGVIADLGRIRLVSTIEVRESAGASLDDVPVFYYFLNYIFAVRVV